MASVGEPIIRPRYTRQRDRSQTVLAAPRDTRGAAPHQAVPGAPLAGRPGVILQLIGFVIAVGFSFVAHGAALEVYASHVTSIAAAAIVSGHYLEYRSQKAYAARGGLFPPEEDGPFIKGSAKLAPLSLSPLHWPSIGREGLSDASRKRLDKIAQRRGYSKEKVDAILAQPGSRDFYEVTPHPVLPVMGRARSQAGDRERSRSPLNRKIQRFRSVTAGTLSVRTCSTRTNTRTKMGCPASSP